MYQSQKSNFSDHFLFKICIFLVFETKTWKMRGMTYTFLVEWRPIQWTFWCFFSYFDLRNSISPLDTHFISKLPKCVKIRKDGLKVPKNGIFQQFLAVLSLDSIDYMFFSLPKPFGTILLMLALKKKKKNRTLKFFIFFTFPEIDFLYTA